MYRRDETPQKVRSVVRLNADDEITDVKAMFQGEIVRIDEIDLELFKTATCQTADGKLAQRISIFF